MSAPKETIFLRIYFDSSDSATVEINALQYGDIIEAIQSQSRYFYADGRIIFIDHITHIDVG